MTTGVYFSESLAQEAVAARPLLLPEVALAHGVGAVYPP